MLVYHQVARSVVRRESALRPASRRRDDQVRRRSGPARARRSTTYRVVNRTTPNYVHVGFKLFFTEDRRNHGRLMSPREVLALHPRPDYVMYE